jgi:hypothetical protein
MLLVKIILDQTNACNSALKNELKIAPCRSIVWLWRETKQISMTFPFMPKATAVWLVNHTSLTFDQIADFCGLHSLEVQGIADGEVAASVTEEDPIINGQLTKEEIARCQKDQYAKLQMTTLPEEMRLQKIKIRRGGTYVPIARRRDKPSAIMWLIKNYPDITDASIMRLLGTTRNLVSSVRNKSHWDIANIKPKDPVLLGICSQSALDSAVANMAPNKT